jgi:glycosyltransferase involved in cell wall biosynthesis
MRFLFAVNIPYPEGRANTRRIRTIARELVKQGHQVRILLPFARGSHAAYKIIDGVHVNWCLIPQNESEFLNKKKRVKLIIQIFSRLRWLKQLYKFTNVGEYEWLYLYQPGIDGFVAGLLAKCCGKKIISEYVDMLLTEGYAGPVWRLIYCMQVLADKMVPQFADVILTISTALKIKYERLNSKSPIVLFPTLVDTSKFGGGDHAHFRRRFDLGQRQIIAFTGSFVRTEGLHLLVEAVSRILNNYPEICLIIAGGSLVPESDDAVELITRFKLQSNALYLGSISESEVIDLQAASDILVMPKLDAPVNHAGLATKLSEYLASGNAVIASNVGDVGKYLTNMHDALLVTPGNLNELEKALLALLNDSELRGFIGNNGRSVALKNFDVSINVQRLVNVLES